VDYLSLHRYYGNREGDTPHFLARSLDMDLFIKEVAAICDAVGAKKKNKKQINLSFDEWNVWFHSNEQDQALKKSDRWGRALPLLEDIYTFEDALLVGAMLITLMRNADRVKVACMAQLVNVIAPIMTRKGGGVWAQTIFYPLMQASAFGRGVSLQPLIECPSYACKDFDEVPVLDAAATLANDGKLTIFAVNRDLKDDIRLHADLRAFGDLQVTEHSVLHHDDANAVNTEATPDTVAPVKGDLGTMNAGKLSVVLPAFSWNVIHLEKR
jgi:alpha-N-arabinofuranosidase